MTATKRPWHGEGLCPDCGKTIALKKDGTLRHHLPTRTSRYAPPECDGIGKVPGPPEKQQLGVCSCCDRQVRVNERGFPHRHLGPAGFCKGEDFKANPEKEGS